MVKGCDIPSEHYSRCRSNAFNGVENQHDAVQSIVSNYSNDIQLPPKQCATPPLEASLVWNGPIQTVPTDPTQHWSYPHLGLSEPIMLESPISPFALSQSPSQTDSSHFNISSSTSNSVNESRPPPNASTRPRFQSQRKSGLGGLLNRRGQYQGRARGRYPY